MIILPKKPQEVGFIVRKHETPGVMVADGGRIHSIACLIDDNTIGGNLYTEAQLEEYALKALADAYKIRH